jgi:poly(A) polymerase
VADMREIWGLQPRLERRTGRTPYRLLEHLRFRAGYDFLLLRCQAGECDQELGDWWRDFVAADAAGREALQLALVDKPGASNAAPKRKRRRRKPKGDASANTDPAGDATSGELAASSDKDGA